MSNDYSDPRWQRLRLQCMDRDAWKCVACGDGQSTLHVHHKRYCGDIWDSPVEDLQTLCNACHMGLGPHPKAGMWYQRVDQIKKGDCSGKTWSKEDASVTGDTVVLAIQHCPSCACKEFLAEGNQLTCAKCLWAMECRRHLFLHAPASLIDREEQKQAEEAREFERKKKAAVGQLRSWAAKCRVMGLTDADIWAAAFPESAIPLGYQVDEGGLFSIGDIADEDVQKLRAYLTSGMTLRDVVWEIAGTSYEAKKALARCGY